MVMISTTADTNIFHYILSGNIKYAQGSFFVSRIIIVYINHILIIAIGIEHFLSSNSINAGSIIDKLKEEPVAIISGFNSKCINWVNSQVFCNSQFHIFKIYTHTNRQVFNV